jgi:hypothetical protein
LALLQQPGMPAKRPDGAGAAHHPGARMPQAILRRSARCAHCDAKGATVMHPSWGGADVGFVPFPADQMLGYSFT